MNKRVIRNESLCMNSSNSPPPPPPPTHTQPTPSSPHSTTPPHLHPAHPSVLGHSKGRNPTRSLKLHAVMQSSCAKEIRRRRKMWSLPHHHTIRHCSPRALHLLPSCLSSAFWAQPMSSRREVPSCSGFRSLSHAARNFNPFISSFHYWHLFSRAIRLCRDARALPGLILIMLIWKKEKNLQTANFNVIHRQYRFCIMYVREYLNNNYHNHIKIFTDGSVLDSLDSGAGFIIPELKVQKSFYLEKSFSIFTSELYAVLMALNYICNIKLVIYVIFCCWYVLIQYQFYMHCKTGTAKWDI